MKTGITTAIGLFAASLAICTAQQPMVVAQDGVEKFLRMSKRDQQELVASVQEAAANFEGSFLAGVHEALRDFRAAASDGGKRRKERTKKPKKRAPKADATWQLPASVSYRYGVAWIEPVYRKGGRSQREQDGRRVQVEQFLLGMLPDSDLVVAGLQARMDGDRSADEFAAFLESWRNGDESFYEALDRTAGTKDSVFFFDAMLSDFVNQFGKGRTPAAKELKKSLDAAHDALHEAFLSFRQYRAFREAVALSMVLPPDVSLPERLRRYEQAKPGLYSLRQQVLMVLAVHGHDPRVVADLVRAAAPPLPTPLWSARYDPYIGWRKVFADAMPKMIDRAGDTDKFLAMVRDEWLQQVGTVRAQASTMLGLPATHVRH